MVEVQDLELVEASSADPNPHPHPHPNPHPHQVLKWTGDLALVDASSADRIWGGGLDMEGLRAG